MCQNKIFLLNNLFGNKFVSMSVCLTSGGSAIFKIQIIKLNILLFGSDPVTFFALSYFA